MSIINDKDLLRLCLVSSLVGLIFLFIAVQTTKPEEVPMGELNKFVGKTVSVEGHVISKYLSKDGHLFFTVKDNTGQIKVVVFKRLLKKLNIRESEIKKDIHVKIIGRVKMYKKELEIIPEHIIF